MDEISCVRLLEEHDIKPTANRIVVVRALATSMQPQSLAELERKICTIDKSNIFRALSLFREHHHFYCEQCQQTYCLDYAEVPEVSLPEGFEATSSNLMIKGICPHCKK